jgi:hypothetical protein
MNEPLDLDLDALAATATGAVKERQTNGYAQFHDFRRTFDPDTVAALVARAQRAEALEAENAKLLKVAKWVACRSATGFVSAADCRYCGNDTAHDRNCPWLLAREATAPEASRD